MSEQFRKWAARHGVTLHAVNIPHRPDRDDRDSAWDSQALHFMATLSLPDGKPLWSGCYSVGSAFPEMWAKTRAAPHAAKRALAELRTMPNRRSVYAAEQAEIIREAYKRAAPLDVGDILLSLQMDLSGADQPFADWAADLGMDTDSRRALRMYEQCVATREAFRSRLNPDAFRQFLELEDE